MSQIPFKITGVGSLPTQEPAQAMAYVVENYTLPFLPEIWPQDSLLAPLLTAAEESALASGQQEALLCSLIQAPASDLKFGLPRRACWSALQKFVEAGNPPALKLQLCGPATIRAQLEKILPQASMATLISIAHDRLIQACRATLEQTSHWPDSTRVLLQLDEPCWPEHSRPEDQKWLGDFAAELPPHWQIGLHSCALVNIESLLREFPTFWLATDCCINNPREILTGEPMKLHLAQGGGWILGIVDTAKKTIASDEVMDLVRSLAANIDPVYWPRIGLSGSCGTGTRSLQFEHDVNKTLQMAHTFVTTTAGS